MQDLGTVREFLAEHTWTRTMSRAALFIDERSPLGSLTTTKLLDNITVHISDRIKKSAGYAHRSREKGHRILLHPILFNNEEMLNAGPYGTDQLKETFFHELAHHVTHTLWGDYVNPHGVEWFMAMAWFNFIPSRCHDLNSGQMVRYQEQKREEESEEALKELLL